MDSLIEVDLTNQRLLGSSKHFVSHGIFMSFAIKLKYKGVQT